MATTALSSRDGGLFISSPRNGPAELDFPLFVAHVKKPKPQVVRDWPFGVEPNATVKVPHYEAVKTRKMSARVEAKAKGSDDAIVSFTHPSKGGELLDSETSGNVIPDEYGKVLESKRRAKIRGLTEISLAGFRKESKTTPLWGGKALKKETSEQTRSGCKDSEEESLLPVRTLNRESRRKRGSRRRKEGPIETPSKRSVGSEPKKERLIDSVKKENANAVSNSSLVVARNRRSLRIRLGKEGGRGGRAKMTELLRVGIGMTKLASTQGMKKRKGFALSGPAKMCTRSRRNSSTSCKSGDPRKNVIYALRTYDAVRRHLLQKDEIEGKELNKVRADLRAGSFLTRKGFRTDHGGKILGSVPGIEVGDFFFFRMELSLIGMHGPIQAGIGYLTGKETEWNTPVGISIISSSGQDEDDGTGWELLYTGQGGKSATESQGNEDQKLERGNLALDGNIRYRTPVRVIRGIRDSNSPSGRIYTYDGLYTVDSRCSAKGKGGFEEFKFKLSRIIGQPDLGSALLKLSTEYCRTPYSRDNVCVRDISKGRESLPVCVYNDVDDEGGLPPAFDYSTDIKYPTRGKHERLVTGCECNGTCTFDQNCTCLRRNGNMFAYLMNGVLVKEKGLVYECGSHCKCGPSCRNRATQRGLKHHFEVFKKASDDDDGGQEWGVRSWESIPAGTFLCEYTGNILHVLESTEHSKAKRFSLNLKLVPKRSPPWGDVSTILGGRLPSNTEGVWEYPAMSIDSSKSGNLSRFIAHSSFPNVLVQCVLRDREDSRFPHAMLFAMDNIPPFKELTIDYGL